MRAALVELLSSKKVLTTLAGLIVFFAAKYGFDVDKDIALAVLGFFAVLVGAQGATDMGKAAARVHVAANDNAPLPAQDEELDEGEIEGRVA